VGIRAHIDNASLYCVASMLCWEVFLSRTGFMKILKVKNLSVQSEKDKKEILHNISLEVTSGALHILIGPNGSGKSTLAYALMGINRFKATSGEIIFAGKEITKLSVTARAKAGLTLSFQEPAYLEGVKVADFLRVSRPHIKLKEMEKHLSLVGLNPAKILQRKLDQSLSGGERKRIELASVMSMRPKLMILDEPDSGLDIIFYREFYNILRNIREEIGSAILLITHREEPGFIADEATFLNQGKIVCQGNFRGVMQRYCQAVNRKKICPHAR